ncbi:MAG: site-2 protease family protein [Planctomycetaceae bacterium]|jgi:regulator of sigma E protease|nr:site-2 protease family protein [Planctomycetaceae bacterium]
MDFTITLWAAAASPSIWETIINVTIKVLLVIAGINALIIVHEWGHFIAARSCGVRCEKFYIWFDFWGLKFFKFKWGDTEYGLGMFPLGGYVKMLGQEDNPGELKAEFERAKFQNSQIQNTNNANNNVKVENSDNAANAANAKDSSVAEVQNSPKPPENKHTQISIGGPDKPVHIAINITTSQPDSRSAEELQEAIFAPDSYLAKSVPQRLMIIIAGVAMNFIFAIICATAAYHVGIIDTAPIVGNVTPGSPAWESGLQTDDKIKSINGATVRAFMDVNMASVGGAEGVDIIVERNVGGQKTELTKKFKPRKRPNDIAPMMGINPCIRLKLLKVTNYPVDLKARKFYAKNTLEKLHGGDLKLKSIGGKEITSYGSYLDASLEKWGQPVEMTFVRDNAGEEISSNSQDVQNVQSVQNVGESAEQVTVSIPAIPIREVGLRFKMGAITSVLPDSDAAKKSIRVGDEIVAIDDVEDFDPLKLSYIILKKVNAGQKNVKLKIKRNDNKNVNLNAKNDDSKESTPDSISMPDLNSTPKTNESAEIDVNKINKTDAIVEDKKSTADVDKKSGDKVEGNIVTIIVELQPIRIMPQISFLSMQDSLGSTALGLAWDVEPIVVGYLPEASETVKQIPIGSKVISVKLINSAPLFSKNSFSYVENDGVVFYDVGDRSELPYILDNMLQIARTKDDNKKDDANANADANDTTIISDDTKKLAIQFEVIKPDGSNELFPVEIYNSSEYFRADRGLLMSELKVKITANNFGEALLLGFNKTIEYSLAVYITLKRFYDGTVSPRALGGPVLVVQSAYSFVSRGSGAYLLFLCIIGANLAVVNLLPMPPLDGGHVVFLIYEGIFGIPPNIIVQAILSWVGLLLIVLLGLWVIALDFSFIPRF